MIDATDPVVPLVARAGFDRDPDTDAGRTISITPPSRRPATRNHILEATRTALVREGYENITTRRIAEIAGVNIATLHYHFGNKETLLREAMRFALARTETRMREAIHNALNLEDAMDRAFAVIWELMQERPGILRFDLAVRGFRDPSALAEVRQVYHAYEQIVLDLIARDYAATAGSEERTPETGGISHDRTEHLESVGRYMVAAVDGIVLQHTLNADDAKAQSALSLIRRHVLALIAEPTPAHREATGRPLPAATVNALCN